jgi:hypothetical protein
MATEKKRLFRFGMLPALMMARARWWVRSNAQGVRPMLTSFASVRQTATIFAGAFVSALLLVSAATSLPIA